MYKRQVVMFRKSAVLAAGGYQHFPLFEDYYLWIRMLMNGQARLSVSPSKLIVVYDFARNKKRTAYFSVFILSV